LFLVDPPGEPVILGEPPAKQMFAEGDAVNITCLAAGGNPSPTVAWFREPSLYPLPIPHHRQVIFL
jgi:hypothetical protein